MRRHGSAADGVACRIKRQGLGGRQTVKMSEPNLDPEVYPPIDPGEQPPDDPGELLPDTPETLPPAPAEPGPGDPDDPDGVPEPA